MARRRHTHTPSPEIAGIIDRVRRVLDDGMSKREMARRANIPWSNLNDVYLPTWNPTRRTLDALLPVVKEVEGTRRPLAGARNRDSVRVA